MLDRLLEWISKACNVFNMSPNSTEPLTFLGTLSTNNACIQKDNLVASSYNTNTLSSRQMRKDKLIRQRGRYLDIYIFSY